MKQARNNPCVYCWSDYKSKKGGIRHEYWCSSVRRREKEHDRHIKSLSASPQELMEAVANAG